MPNSPYDYAALGEVLVTVYELGGMLVRLAAFLHRRFMEEGFLT